ncbi:CapA family protein [uncultured Maribacter sp.]|uniref:CapA family protein n=1 Tax=uncultured Maribacter sp. TaxID=431308 RepID=UPI0030DBB026|tara:strand:+ start:2125 stop:3225 length:1101 start_codon:yes stop_codon:yes gene_type:complete
MAQKITLCFSGDVMTGRGVDQILPHPSSPVLYESYVKDARHYVELAEKVNGPIPRPVTYDYPWGDTLKHMKDADVRIINLETSITYSEAYVDKGINYRMHPKNIPCLTEADIDCCVLANNHVMDWGTAGLLETLETLKMVGIGYSGAGRDRTEASAPAIIEMGGNGRVLVFSFGCTSSGILQYWKATENSSGVNVLDDFSMETVERINQLVTTYKQPNDVVVASIHWGGNWGYEIPLTHRYFAYHLIDQAQIDIIHGHSSHHFLGIEVYKQKPILFGCGDLLNDYEGISGHESYKAQLGFLYFVEVTTTGELTSLQLVPTEIKKLHLKWPNKKDRRWMQKVLKRECKQFGAQVNLVDNGSFFLGWT